MKASLTGCSSLSITRPNISISLVLPGLVRFWRLLVTTGGSTLSVVTTGLTPVFAISAEFVEAPGDGVVSGGSSSSRDAIDQYSVSVNRVTIAIGMMSRLKVIEFKGHCQLPRGNLNMGFDITVEND